MPLSTVFNQIFGTIQTVYGYLILAKRNIAAFIGRQGVRYHMMSDIAVFFFGCNNNNERLFFKMIEFSYVYSVKCRQCVGDKFLFIFKSLSKVPKWVKCKYKYIC